jgi:hypothetical protein
MFLKDFSSLLIIMYLKSKLHDSSLYKRWMSVSHLISSLIYQAFAPANLTISGKIGVPKPVTGSQPFVTGKPVTPQP